MTEYNHYNEFVRLNSAGKLVKGANAHHKYISECPICGLYYTHDRRGTKTCSDACRVKAGRIRAGRASSRKEAAERMVATKSATIITHTCETCGRNFTRTLTAGGEGMLMYCSNACKQRAYRQRHAVQVGATVPFPVGKGLSDLTLAEMLMWWREMAKENGLNATAMVAELKEAWRGEPEGLEGKRIQLSSLTAHYYHWI